MIKISRNSLKKLHVIINSFSKEKVNTKFAIAISKNKVRFHEEMTVIIDIERPLVEFEKKRRILCQKYSIKNEKNMPTIMDNNYVLQDMDNFGKELETLIKEYSVMDVQAAMNEEVEIDPFLIDENLLPESLSIEQSDALLPICINEKTELEKAKLEIVELKKKIAELTKG